MKIFIGSKMTRSWRWWLHFLDRVGKGTYDEPWNLLTRLLFCRPCHPERDMCGLPAHDYCGVCGRSMPGRAG